MAGDEPPANLTSPGADQLSEQQRLRRRFAAADELSWGGPALTPTPTPGSSLPEQWVDVTDVVLAALEQVRERERQLDASRSDTAESS